MTPLEKYCSFTPSEKRAMKWLNSICKDQKWVNIHSFERFDVENERTVLEIEMTVESLSERIYELTICVGINENKFGRIFESTLRGKVNLGVALEHELSWHEQERMWCSLCLGVSHEHEENLPLCDHLVSMALGLRDDKGTAMRLPMLDLFLAHDEKDHIWIESYDLNGPETGIYGCDYGKLVPLEIRMLCHKFACINDELQGSAFENFARFDIIADEMKKESLKIRRTKLGHLEP